MKIIKENKGITLIALVITIVVLLILAGVTINAITGSESAMEKATQAKEENNIANELEQIKLSITNAMAQGLDGKVSDVNLRNALQGIIDDEELENITGDGPWTITTKLNKTYEINGYGQIEPAATPTDIYVTLDGDTLRFYAQKDNVSGILVNEKNGNKPINLRGEGFTVSASDNPWYNNTNIKKISFEEVVVPTSTMRWFGNCSGITNIENIERLNTRYVTNMNRMFYGCSSLKELDLSKFNTKNVTDMTSMFCNCSNLATIYVGNGWNIEAVTQSDYMFYKCSNLVGGKETRVDSVCDKSRAKVDGGISDPGYFTHINDKGYDYLLAWGTPQNATLYGNDVTYTSYNGTSSWKLFYQNEKNTYLISTNTTNAKYIPYNYYSNYTAESFNDEKNVAKKLNPKLALKKGELFIADTLNANMKALAWFCDTDYWKGYTSENTTASRDKSTSYAVFSPSLELLTISFNSDKNDANFTAELPEPITGIKGYNFLYSNTTLPTNYNNGIYSSAGGTYWISSPYNETQYGNASFFDRHNGVINSTNVINTSFYGRPIVCIPNSSFDNKTISGYVE